MARMMAKIMTRPPRGSRVARYQCNGQVLPTGGGRRDPCGSDIEFSENDIVKDDTYEYVECPVCESWVDSSVLHWENA